jgi:hypothetical protein
MTRWSWYRTRVALLAILLGLGMSLSFVQGSVMAAAMAFGADGAHHGSSGCDGCGGGDHDDMNAGTCLIVCASAVQGLVSGVLLPLPSASRTAVEVASSFPSGQAHAPDYDPPRSSPLADA